MSTSLSSNEFEAFYAFLGELRNQPNSPSTPEESVRQFRESQKKLERFQELNQIAIEQSSRGLSKPLDLKSLLERIEQRVAREGSSK
jgi:hypothetical protein